METLPKQELAATVECKIAGTPEHDRRATQAAEDELTRPLQSSADTAPAPKRPAFPPERFAHDYCDPLIPTRRVDYEPLKRLFDVLISVAGLIAATPVMLIAAILVRITSRGPIIFKQVRVGRGGRFFWCYKFRSMKPDAEAIQARLMDLNEADGPVFKIANDPRFTPVGRFLRRTSIDELPQLFNVLKGDMSIVGPRPPLPTEVAQYSTRHLGRLAVQPGITCIWQCSGRSNIPFERWVELDLLYIENMSFRLDLKLLLLTLPAVLTGTGAH